MQYTHATPVVAEPFESLLVAQLEGLMHQALRFTRARSAAEDLVQETAARALRFRDQFTMGTNFKAWVSTILTHTFIHGYRHGQRERDAAGPSGRDLVAERLGQNGSQSFYASPDLAVTTLALGDEVSRALANLPPEFRQVVALCDIEGHSYKAIAERLGCPIGTVMSRLHRARRQLGRQLAEFAAAEGIVREPSVREAAGSVAASAA